MPQSKTLFRNPTKSSSQSGNIFVFILVGIFLFGALIYTFTRTSETGSSNFSKQEAKIAAQEILNYSRIVEDAVDRLRRNGCSESEISFSNTLTLFYYNPNSPLDESCHVFAANGGNIQVLEARKNWLENSLSHIATFGDYVYTSYIRVENIGTDNTELIIYIPYIEKIVCESINDLMDISTPIPQDVISGTGYARGEFIPAVTPDLGDEAPANKRGHHP